ncbi:MAG: glycosyltransferase family 39 protein [Gammaproteobacteria bacterium]|nr:glycosyltransferase family 39 protein [Gammaproteobacteria bacterium]
MHSTAPLSTQAALILLVVFAALLFLVGLDQWDLWSSDEPRVAGIGAAIARSGDLLVPRLNGHPYLEKPPLYFWISAGIFEVFGESTFNARLPSALAAVGGIVLLFVLARQMAFSPTIALLAGVILAASPEYWAIGHRVIVDMLLCLSISSAMLAFYSADRHLQVGTLASSRRAWPWIATLIVCLAAAVMTKALVGLAIPLTSILSFLVFRTWLKRAFHPSSWVVLVIASILCFIPFGVWLWFQYTQYGWQMVYDIVWLHNLARFSGDNASHVQPFYFYLVKFPKQFFPWTLLLPLAAIYHYRMIRYRGDTNSLFLLCWLIIPFLLLSISANKRGIYLLPIYPAASLFVAVAAVRFVEERGWNLRFYWPTVIKATAISYLALTLTIEFLIWPAKNARESYVPLFEYCATLEKGGADLRLYEPLDRIRGAAVFYLGRNISELGGQEALAGFLKNQNAIVLTYSENLPEVGGIQVLKNFLISGKRFVVVKGNTVEE